MSSYSQDSAIIAEFTDEIKGHASPPPAPAGQRPNLGHPTCRLLAGYPSHPSPPKVGTYTVSQGTLLLDPDQCLETLPIRI
jgi:hypothetical protein